MKGGVILLIVLHLFIPQFWTREVVNFDFSWRFKLYPEFQCPANAFLLNVSDLVCYGLNDLRANTPDQCRDACCAQTTCEVWQFTYGVKGIPCKVGISDNCTTTKLKVIGERREKAVDPSPPSKTPETMIGFDDSKWEVINVPHDSIISQPYRPINGPLEAYLSKNMTWYRKHFNLPLEWKGASVWLYFEGIFRASSIYLNGNLLKFHDGGYTSFPVRLDNALNVTFGEGMKNENVLAVRCLGSGNYGWWYEGSGIYRHVQLVAANTSHIVPDSLYAMANITSAFLPHVKTDLSKGLVANVTFNLQANITNDNATSTLEIVIVRFTLFNQINKNVGTVNSAKVNISTASTVVRTKLSVAHAEIWSNLRPYLYTLQVELLSGTLVLDSINVSIGARNQAWNNVTGFHMNAQHFVWRGFNNHNHFAGVGIAIPDRINLFQVQSMRAIGGNSWRTSYNPASPTLLNIMDRLGVVVWEETREFGKHSEWVEEFRSMIRRDRNHPSIVVWSICNGAECNVYDWYNTSLVFKQVSKEEDSLRPVSANMFVSNDSNVLDVQGLSHAPGPQIDAFHKRFPTKPLIGSECCSCPSQRGEDDKTPKTFGGFNADCIQAQTTIELARSFMAGCLVYTLFDHYGEANLLQWPHVSSSFGAFDIAGFPKASTYWYRSLWLLNARKAPALKDTVPLNPPTLVNPAVSDSSTEDVVDGILIHIVQHWDERPNAMKHSINVYTNAPQTELEVNGESKGRKPVGPSGWAQWDNIVFIPGTIKAYALNVKGETVATHTIETPGVPTKILLGVDVPSVATGTGSALVLDGQDTGLVHAAIVDSKGHLVNMAENNITFRIVSGPGRIIGVGNGNPACLEPNQATWRSAYHGLARLVVQVTVDQSTLPLHRKRLMQIDRDGGIRTIIMPPGFQGPIQPIVIEASSVGLSSSQVSIPVSDSIIEDGVLSVAEKQLLSN